MNSITKVLDFKNFRGGMVPDRPPCMTKGPPTQNMPKGPVFLRYATAKGRFLSNWFVIKPIKRTIIGPTSLLQYILYRNTCLCCFGCCCRPSVVWLECCDIQSSVHHNCANPSRYSIFRDCLVRLDKLINNLFSTPRSDFVFSLYAFKCVTTHNLGSDG